jgi:tetratricopeptide (TPR) repeat protein
MDDFKQSRYLRRLALLAAISCSATAIYAAETAIESPSSFRSLIAQGWKQNVSAETDSTTEAASTTDSPGASEQTAAPEAKTPTAAPVEQTDTNQDARAKQDARPAATAVESIPESAPQTALDQSVKANPPKPEQETRDIGLAELIRSQAKAIAVPKSTVQPMTAAAPKTVTVPKSIEALTPVAVTEAITASKPAQAPSPVDEPVANVPEPNQYFAAEIVAPTPVSDRSPTATEQLEFELFPLTDVQPDAPIRANSLQGDVPEITNSQAIFLRESARASLHNAQQRLRRRATHSARMYAREALRSIVAMQDAEQGGNAHLKQLDAALSAIRESRDFGIRFGAIDGKAMTRMVAAHETTVLKDRDLEDLTTIEASQAYLLFAQENLVQAAGHAQEASDALVILGNVERGTASQNNAYASAVAVMMQQTAVEISPNSMIAHRELGTTLSQQGLSDQAAASLKQSLSIRPTRSGYVQLLEVSRRCGDIDMVRECVAALKSDKLPSEIAVHNISPKRFATTHRPNLASIPSNKAKTTSAASHSETVDSKTSRISLRSLMPFGRK